MRIGILTFHRADNYGAVLQAYALNKVLNELGSNAEEIDYYPDYFKSMYLIKPPISIRHPRTIITLIKRILFIKKIHKRRSEFQAFVDSYINISKSISKRRLLTIDKLNYDVLIAGSDQVWNDICANFDPIYFLCFKSARNIKKYSYAASFNTIYIPNDKRDEYVKRLQGYTDYSVREQSGVSILKNLLNVDARIDCDPTFLLSKEQWFELVGEHDIKSITHNAPYILVYYVKQSRVLMEYAKSISLRKDIRVICIPCKLSFDVINSKLYSEYDFTFLPLASPLDFLSLIKNADYVLTNSFHGTAFSLIFNKQFYSVMDFDDGGKNTRSRQLLDSVICSNRIMDSRTNISSIDDMINWECINEIIHNEREKSLRYLKGICGIDHNE